MNKHTAICPDGTIVKRNSKSRTYSHVIVARNDYAASIANATSTGWNKTDRSNFDYYHAFLDGTSEWPITAERIATARDNLAGCETVEAYIEHRRAVRVAAAEAVDQTKWLVMGWASRRDLAQKVAGNARQRYAEVEIIEAQIS